MTGCGGRRPEPAGRWPRACAHRSTSSPSPGARSARPPTSRRSTTPTTAVAALHDLFFATPYRPTGLSTADRAVIRLVDELRWLNGVVLQSSPRRHRTDPGPHVCAVKRAAADVLDEVAAALITPAGDCRRVGDAAAALHTALAGLEQGTTMHLPRSGPGHEPGRDGGGRGVGARPQPSGRRS